MYCFKVLNLLLNLNLKMDYLRSPIPGLHHEMKQYLLK